MIVVDASVVVGALADDGTTGARVRSRLRGQRGLAPELLDVEVINALRGMARGGAVDGRRAEEALQALASLPFQRVPHRGLQARVWGLRHNLTPYDAVYVALAEAAGATLLTADAALAGAPGVECAVELMA